MYRENAYLPKRTCDWKVGVSVGVIIRMKWWLILLWQYLFYRALPCVCCHSPALLRAHWKGGDSTHDYTVYDYGHHSPGRSQKRTGCKWTTQPEVSCLHSDSISLNISTPLQVTDIASWTKGKGLWSQMKVFLTPAWHTLAHFRLYHQKSGAVFCYTVSAHFCKVGQHGTACQDTLLHWGNKWCHAVLTHFSLSV